MEYSRNPDGYRNTLVIGTRGSRLALIQAEKVKQALERVFQGKSRDNNRLGGDFSSISIKIKTIKTRGDKRLDSPLSKIGEKGLFIREIEEALLSGEVDIAVHSLKDLPVQIPGGLKLGGVLKRDEPRDVLVSLKRKQLIDLEKGDTLATSSLRRKAQILYFNRELRIVDVRGNVDTRLRKLKEGLANALILAGAGLLRAGYEEEITEFIPMDIMLPAACQGIIAMETREDDPFCAEIVEAVTHSETFICAKAERAFLKIMEGGCQVPIGCYSQLNGTGIESKFSVTGLISDLEGKRLIRKSAMGAVPEAEKISAKLAEEILASGGVEILDEIRGVARNE
ncbi:MAG: hydroxymethylbilane synthase [Spirochaetes bacterium]|nr:MAG: hydroxymethylbilane synthase [Spirochaetota bacterium]